MKLEQMSGLKIMANNNLNYATSLFMNKRSTLNEMLQRNASKFVGFFVFFSFCATLILLSYECPDLC